MTLISVIFPDLQFIARGNRGAGRGQGWPPDHRDQRAERGGCAAREDRQPARHLRRGGETRLQLRVLLIADIIPRST